MWYQASSQQAWKLENHRWVSVASWAWRPSGRTLIDTPGAALCPCAPLLTMNPSGKTTHVKERNEQCSNELRKELDALTNVIAFLHNEQVWSWFHPQHQSVRRTNCHVPKTYVSETGREKGHNTSVRIFSVHKNKHSFKFSKKRTASVYCKCVYLKLPKSTYWETPSRDRAWPLMPGTRTGEFTAVPFNWGPMTFPSMISSNGKCRNSVVLCTTTTIVAKQTRTNFLENMRKAFALYLQFRTCHPSLRSNTSDVQLRFVAFENLAKING